MVVQRVVRAVLLLGIALCSFVGLYALMTPGVPHTGAGVFTILLMGLYYGVGKL